MRRKGAKIYVEWKGYNNSFNSWIDKKRYHYIKMSYFSEPYIHSKHKIEVGLDLSNYAIKSDLKNVTSVGTLNFGKKTDLANLKSDFDKVDIDELKTIPSGLRSLKSKLYKLDIAKLETAPVDLSKLSHVAKNDIT